MPKTYYNKSDAAAKLGISRAMLDKYIDQGRIPSTTIAGRELVEEKHLKKPKPRKPGPKPQ